MTDRDPISSVTFASAPTPSPAPGSLLAPGAKVWQDGETTSFRDVLAILNPLQHIPIVSSIYRAATGDDIGFMPRVLGGTLYGGPIGLAIGLANGLMKEETGRDAGETVIASLFGKDAPSAPDIPTDLAAEAPKTIQVASAAPAAALPVPEAPAETPFAPVPIGFQGKSPAPNPLAARFRSTDLPQPTAEGGGVPTQTAKDLVPTAAGTAISRDAVPAAMASALEKYSAMMRARNAAQGPTQVSVLG